MKKTGGNNPEFFDPNPQYRWGFFYIYIRRFFNPSTFVDL